MKITEENAHEYIHGSSGHMSLRSLDVTELYVPKGVTKLFCRNNKLTELVLPGGVEEVWCQHNLLTEIHLPDSTYYLNGWGNDWDPDFVKWHNMKYSKHKRLCISDKWNYPGTEHFF